MLRYLELIGEKQEERLLSVFLYMKTPDFVSPYSLRAEGRSDGAVGTAQAAVFRRRKTFRLFKTVGKVEAVLKANGIGNLFNGKIAFSQHFHSPVDTQITYILIQGFSGRIFKQYAEIFGRQLKAGR